MSPSNKSFACKSLLLILIFSFPIQSKVFASNNFTNYYSSNKYLEKTKNYFSCMLIDTYDKKNLELTFSQIKTRSMFIWVFFIIYCVSLVYTFFYFFKIKSKHQLEKKLIEDRNKIVELKLFEVKKNLELKNKKLATSALQAIENEELKKQFIERLQNEIPCKYHSKLKQLSVIFKNNSKNNWNEFKTHFEQINDGFFIRLKTEYPSLSPSELKLCSFLKLNLSSKDIALLMGISYDSVKMGRYRIRKKLSLSRDINLVTFISKF